MMKLQKRDVGRVMWDVNKENEKIIRPPDPRSLSLCSHLQTNTVPMYS